MQPRRRARTCRVTNTPRFSEKTPSLGNGSGRRSKETAWVTASRARHSKVRRSSSERDGILGLFAAFEHAQPAALLDAVVEMSPELQEVLRGGNQGADHHQPE